MTIKVTKLAGPGAGERSEIDNLDALPTEMTRLLDEPIYATVATLRKSGPPHVTVVFCDRDSDYVYINSAKGRIKDVNLRARPEITLHVMSPTNVRHWMSVEGKVVEMIDEEDPERAASCRIAELKAAPVDDGWGPPAPSSWPPSPSPRASSTASTKSRSAGWATRRSIATTSATGRPSRGCSTRPKKIPRRGLDAAEPNPHM